jgi:hypothetical protein
MDHHALTQNVPAPGQPVVPWRQRADFDFNGWTMGEKVQSIEDMEIGALYLADSSFFRHITMVVAKKLDVEEPARFGWENAVMARVINPQKIEEGPLLLQGWLVVKEEFGGTGHHQQDYYRVSRA